MNKVRGSNPGAASTGQGGTCNAISREKQRPVGLGGREERKGTREGREDRRKGSQVERTDGRQARHGAIFLSSQYLGARGR